MGKVNNADYVMFHVVFSFAEEKVEIEKTCLLDHARHSSLKLTSDSHCNLSQDMVYYYIHLHAGFISIVIDFLNWVNSNTKEQQI